MKCHHLMGKALTDVPLIFTRKQSSLDPVSQLVTDYLFILFPHLQTDDCKNDQLCASETLINKYTGILFNRTYTSYNVHFIKLFTNLARCL